MPQRPALAEMLMTVGGLAALLGSTAAQARDGGWRNGSWYADGAPSVAAPPIITDTPPAPERLDRAPAMRDHGDERWSTRRVSQPGREAWLADCRSRLASRDNGVGGAVIGGVVGGIAGNRIAGRHNRMVGTVAGAAVGAVAGSAIDRVEDSERDRDECEAYLDDYYARYAASYGGPAYPGYPGGYAQPGYTMSYAPTYGYPAGGCCGSAPVMVVPVQSQPECTETVEYIYEDVPVRRRSYRPAPKRTKIVADKRIRVAPDKRVAVN
jgi:hypothetical protein